MIVLAKILDILEEGEASLIEEGGNTTYLAFAAKGTMINNANTFDYTPSFKIKRIQVNNNGTTTTMWADGNKKYNKNWSLRTTYPYKFLNE
jgi:hypothetical protein